MGSKEAGAEKVSKSGRRSKRKNNGADDMSAQGMQAESSFGRI